MKTTPTPAALCLFVNVSPAQELAGEIGPHPVNIDRAASLRRKKWTVRKMPVYDGVEGINRVGLEERGSAIVISGRDCGDVLGSVII